jgi:hypothetical protein
MSHHLEDENLLTWVKNARHETILVPTNVKDNAVSNKAGGREVGFDISPRMPRDGLAADMGMPRPQPPVGVGVPLLLPERPQSGL